MVFPENHVSEVLPVLAANRKTCSVMFSWKNAAGPGKMIEALGRERVLLGFPGALAVATPIATRAKDTLYHFVERGRSAAPAM